MYLFSIGLYLFVDKTCRKDKLQKEDHPVTKSDFLLSLLTVICNSFIMLLGVLLWKSEWITLDNNTSAGIVFLEVVALILLMDFCMYLFHYAAHAPSIYKMLHGKHHEHISTNFLSLFVLHPFETIGFGLMMIVLLICYNFSLTAIIIYLTINLMWGTIGHLNREFFPAKFDQLGIGTTRFHNLHHLDERKTLVLYLYLGPAFRDL